MISLLPKDVSTNPIVFNLVAIVICELFGRWANPVKVGL